MIVVVAEDEPDLRRLFVGPLNKILEYEIDNASNLAGCMILHSSISIFTRSAKFKLAFCWGEACKSEMSIFQTHAGECLHTP